MRIGVMLRHFKSQKGGIGTYTRNLLDNIINIDRKNKYIFIYNDRDLKGFYSKHPNVEEVLSNTPSNLIWDQIIVPSIIKRKKIDLIFNPKLSIPIFADCKKVFVLHGADWFVFPENYKLYDHIYHKIFTPWYCGSSDAIISVSKDATKHICKNVKVSPKKIKTIYHGVNNNFKFIKDKEKLELVRNKYGITSYFILYIGQIYPMKNVGNIIKAFNNIHERIPHKLVIVGKSSLKYKDDLALINKYHLENDVIVTGWVPDEDLPALYNLADLFVFPSLYEGFGIPLLESMACGCPIVTSNRGAPMEVVEDAAVLVDPCNVKDIAKGIYDVLTNTSLRSDIIEKGFRRVRDFSWEKCAKETLEVFEEFNNK